MPTFGVGATPWYAYSVIIRNVVLGEGIASVGRCAFYNCYNIESVTLPSTLATIQEYAFYKCSALTEITIPANVTEIGIYAFRQSGVEVLNFTVKYGWSAGDVNFTASELANGAAQFIIIGYYNQVWIRDTEAEFEAVASNYVDGGMCNATVKWMLFWTDETQTTMMLTIYGSGDMPEFGTGGTPWYGYVSQIVAVVVEEGVTGIGRCSFYNSANLTEVTLNEGLLTIGDYAFDSCRSLTDIDIPSTVIYISETAFNKTGIEEVPTV